MGVSEVWRKEPMMEQTLGLLWLASTLIIAGGIGYIQHLREKLAKIERKRRLGIYR